MKKLLFVAIAAVGLAGAQALPQSIPDLLQKGIYTQETLGDVDGAIKIYRQIVASAKDARVYAAQAQFRLGVCLLKKGDQAEATKVFESLIQDYPEQKELVAKAREYLPGDMKLLPAPWAGNEAMELRLRMQAGLVIGTMVYSVEPGRNRSDTWLFQTRSYMSLSNQRWMTWVEAERESLRPVSSLFDNPVTGKFSTEYQGNQARVAKANEEARPVEVESPFYDNEEAIQLLRRLPLAQGFKRTLNIFSPAARMVLKLKFEVTAIEELQVPAGKFRCYKVNLDFPKQTFWIAADPQRYLVKFDAGAVVAELNSVRKGDDLSAAPYQDSKLGYSVSVPPSWFVQPPGDTGTKNEGSAFLLDPEMAGTAIIWAGQQTAGKDAIDAEMRKEAEQKIESRSKTLVGYKVRPGGMQNRMIGGRKALTYIADYTDDKKSMVEYLTWVRGESVSALFIARAEAGAFEGFRKRVDPILETLQVK